MLSNNQVHILSSNMKQSSTALVSSLKPIQINKVISNNFNLERHTSTNSSADTIQFQYHRNHQQPNSQQQQQQTSTANPMQIQNYVTWINSHLKKRPGVKLVENLQTDVSNGVCLIHLIEVISGTVLTDVNLNPKTQADGKDNIEKILKFMHQNAIKMHQTNSKEILDGNLKSIMRLVLALAAHYKPTNVQPYSAVIGRNNQTYSPSSSSSNQNNMAQTVNNKRSYSTNHINSQPSTQTNKNNNYANNTYVIDSLKSQIQQANFNQRPVLNSTRNLDSMTHLVQAACVSLADVRRFKNENFNVKYVKRNNLDSPARSIYPNSNQTYSLANNVNNHETNNINENCTMANYTMSSPSAVHPIASSTVLLPNKQGSPRNLTFVLNKMSDAKTDITDDVDLLRKESDNKENHIMNKTKLISINKELKNETTEPSLALNNKNSYSLNQENKLQHPTELLLNELQNQFDNYQCDTLEDVQNLKSILLNLQTLLINENTNDMNIQNNQGEEALINDKKDNFEFSLSNLTPEEQITIMRSKIQQMEILSADLRNELNLIKSETMHKNGIQSGLKTRLAEQDNTILELKDEQLNMHLVNQQLLKEKEDLNFKLNERILQINQLKQEICKRDDYIDTLKLEINNLLNEKEHTNFVRQQVKQVSDTLEYVQEKENVLSDLIASADRKLIKIDNQLAFNHQQMNKEKMNKCYQILNKDEEQILKQSLLKLRQSLNINGSSQYLINTLEQTFLTIIDRLNLVQSNTNNNLTTPASTSSSNFNGPTTALHTSTTTPISSSTSSSLTSSSANSPVLQVVQSSHLSLSSSINSTASSSSSSSSLSAVPIGNNNTTTNNNNSNNTNNNINNHTKNNNDINENVELPNNESNVKKIISRLFSQNNQTTAKDDNQTIRFKSLNGTNNSSSNTLLTISSNVMNNSESIQSCSTKCIYYMDNKTNSPPFMITIPKNIGTITLSDFKEYIKLKHGSSYIYHFKAQDPEFGIVKEEISSGHKILPSFENRIIAWIQEMD